MSVMVAYQASSESRTQALAEAAREAQLRSSKLTVVHVVENVDLDVADAYEHSLREEVETALGLAGPNTPGWQLQLRAVKGDNVAETILDAVDDFDAEVLIIGARRRSPVGKFLLGSVTQTLILQSAIPVLVVKAPAKA